MATAEDKKTETVTIEVDGRELEAPKGAMIIEVTDRAGIEIPRFCYHRKLSIAANCRMCLVDVEKAPKPLPACATPVADGMKVFTRSRRAVDAQRGVMEFLLINHPLDCPICDQGGECELQDLAMGYGRSISRFTERKRVVKDKNLGPLVATDMTRCIHCTRCVRFLEEIAGTAELGGVGRGENLKISTFIERNIDSELSGNIIDLCPVGALTNKPFRYSARAWEMSARPHVGVHDCVGSNLHYHVRRGEIMRAVPRENEDVNECWLADRDRYSHFGLAADDRVTAPMVKRDGEWAEVDWDEALERAAQGLKGVAEEAAEQVGLLASPRATTEEHFLLRRLAEGLGTPHRDHRLRVADDTDPRLGRAHMDRPTKDLSKADAVFLVGSHLRHDQPILNHRVRTAWRENDAKIMDLNPVAWEFPFDMSERMIVAPQNLAETLARVAHAAYRKAGKDFEDDGLGRYVSERSPEPAAESIAAALSDADSGVLLVGDQALFHPRAALIRALAERIAAALDVALMVLPGPANSEGAWRAGNVPAERGMSAHRQLDEGRRAFVLWDLEPEFDCADPAAARRSLAAADFVVAAAAFAGTDLKDAADVILPLAAIPEADGSVVNADGQRQLLKAAGKAPEQARAGWKILRVLGERLGLEGFDFTSLNDVAQSLDGAEAPTVEASAIEPAGTADDVELWRTGPVPIYGHDALVRRARPLQDTHHGDTGFIVVHPATAERLGLAEGGRARLKQGGGEVTADVHVDEDLPPESVWMPSATCLSSRLGAAWAPIEVEAAE